MISKGLANKQGFLFRTGFCDPNELQHVVLRNRSKLKAQCLSNESNAGFLQIVFLHCLRGKLGLLF